MDLYNWLKWQYQSKTLELILLKYIHYKTYRFGVAWAPLQLMPASNVCLWPHTSATTAAFGVQLRMCYYN